MKMTAFDWPAIVIAEVVDSLSLYNVQILW